MSGPTYSNTTSSLVQHFQPTDTNKVVTCPFVAQTVRHTPVVYETESGVVWDTSGSETTPNKKANIELTELVDSQKQPRLSYPEMASGVNAASLLALEKLGFNRLVGSSRGEEMLAPVNEAFIASVYSADPSTAQSNAATLSQGLAGVGWQDTLTDYQKWFPVDGGKVGGGFASEPTNAPYQGSTPIFDFILNPPCSWYQYFALKMQSGDSSSPDSTNLATSPLFNIVMAMCRAQVLYGMAFTGETTRNNLVNCPRRDQEWIIAVMGVIPTIKDTTTVLELFESVFQQPGHDSTSPPKDTDAHWMGQLPRVPPSTSGIYEGRNEGILQAYIDARRETKGCSLASGLAAVMLECPSWGQEENCVKRSRNASYKPGPSSWGVGLTLVELLVGETYYGYLTGSDTSAIPPRQQGLLSAINENVEIFVPGIPGAFSLRCASIGAEGPDCPTISSYNLCGSSAAAARAIADWIISAVPTLSPANRISLYNQILTAAPDSMTGAGNFVTLALAGAGAGQRRNETVTVLPAEGQALVDDESQTLSRSYELTAYNDPNTIILRADLTLGIQLFCRDSMSHGSSQSVAQAVKELGESGSADGVQNAINNCLCSHPVPHCGPVSLENCGGISLAFPMVSA